MTPPSPSSLRARAEELITKWRSDAHRLTAMSCFTTADHVRQCADELEALLTDARVPAGEGEAEWPDDYGWALERVTNMCASALADAHVYGRKLLKGFGYPNETFSRAQDYRALRIVLEVLRESSPAAPPEPEAVKIGYCLGSPSRPHRQVEWLGCYTSCTLCHMPLRYGTVENVERIIGKQRPVGWSPEQVIGYPRAARGGERK